MTDSHYSCVIFWREGDEGPEYLVIEYNSGDGVQIKFPGGTNKDRPGETPTETAHREIRIETSIVMTGDPEKIYTSSATRDKVHGGIHLKHAFLMRIENTAGEMRTMPMDDEGDKLSPPFWRTFTELLIDPGKGGLFWTHRPMLQAAIGELQKLGKYPVRP